MKRRKILKIAGIVAGSFFLLIGLLVGAAALLLTPKRLTPLVSDLCNQYLDAQVRFDTVSVSLFQDFPFVTLRLRGTEVISHAFSGLPDSLRQEMPTEADTLARIGALDVSLNPWKLVSGKADVRRIGLEDTHLHGYVARNGRTNWDIYQADTAVIDDAGSSDIEININRISILNGLHLVYNSLPDKMAGEIELEHLLIDGKLSSELLQNDIRKLNLRNCGVNMAMDGRESGLTIGSLTINGEKQTDYTLGLEVRNMRTDSTLWLDSLRLQSGIRFHGADHKEVTIDHFRLYLDQILLTASGEVGFHGDSIATRLDVQTKDMKFSDLLHMVPASILPLVRDYETNLTTDLNIAVRGGYNASTGTLPDVTADVKIPAGYLAYTKGRNGSRIDTLALDATVRYRPQSPDSTSIDLRELKIAGIGLSLDAKGTAEKLMGDVEFDGVVKGDLSLDYLTRHFPSSDGSTFRGRITLDLNGRGQLSQLTPARIGGSRLRGKIHVDTLRIEIPKQDFHLMVGRGMLGVGTGTAKTDSLIAKGTQAVGATITLDTVDMDMGRDLCVTGRQIKVHATTSTRNLTHDTTAVHPSQGTLAAQGLQIRMGDSTSFIGRGLDGKWSILPAPSNPATPRMSLHMDVRRLSMREAESRYSIRKGCVEIEATLYKEDSTRIRQRDHRLDSLQQLYPGIKRDSIFAYVRAKRATSETRISDGFNGGDLDLHLSSDLSSILRRWQVSGRIDAASGRIVTPYFPLATTLRDIDVTFNTDEVHLNRTFIKAGESQMVITGDVTGLRRAMLGRGRVKGNLKVEADTLNLNEIVRVVNAGSALVAQGGVRETESDDALEQRIVQSVDTSSMSSLLIVPGNIDMKFDMKVHHGVYANLTLDSLAGEVIARDRVLQLSDLTMHSNAGNLKMTGLYATRTPQDIQTGFDLEMEDMQVHRLIELIPSIDTLMPMLRSFEGVVDCQIAVTARLDSAMNILMPSLNAACRIVGDSLVLLDGETFTEISKMLMFKNKKHNMIDHISAEMLVRDSQIEIFPFVVEIDRYRAAVSGVHKMDMTFNYHISVLKSPIPFRLGVDIFGNLDDFDFKITRARYKSANLPTRVALIEDTRLNLRNYIRDVFHRGVEASDIASLRITPETKSPTELLPVADSLTAADTTALQNTTPVLD